MQDLKEDMKIIVAEINVLLNRYIEIHNDVFKFSLRKIIPLPFVFKTIDFNELHNKAKQILAELEVSNKRINSLIKYVHQKESLFAHFLAEYCAALIETVSLLKRILYQLYLKSENSNEYNLSEHNKMLKSYEETVNKYSAIGTRLNKLYQESIQ